MEEQVWFQGKNKNCESFALFCVGDAWVLRRPKPVCFQTRSKDATIKQLLLRMDQLIIDQWIIVVQVRISFVSLVKQNFGSISAVFWGWDAWIYSLPRAFGILTQAFCFLCCYWLVLRLYSDENFWLIWRLTKSHLQNKILAIFLLYFGVGGA